MQSLNSNTDLQCSTVTYNQHALKFKQNIQPGKWSIAVTKISACECDWDNICFCWLLQPH